MPSEWKSTVRLANHNSVSSRNPRKPYLGILIQIEHFKAASANAALLRQLHVVILLIVVIKNILHCLQVFIILGVIDNRLAHEVTGGGIRDVFAILLTRRLFGAVLSFLFSPRIL